MFAGRQRPVKKSGHEQNQSNSFAAPIKNSNNQAPASQTASSAQDTNISIEQPQNISTPTKQANRTSIAQVDYPETQNSLARFDSDEVNTIPSAVTDVMTIVRLSWDFMTNPEFNPVPFALSLLDGSSLGNDYNSFCSTCDRVEKAMDTIVNDYHLAFNNSIQRFSSVVDTIADSQKKVKEMIDNLDMSKDTLECKRFDFLHLWVKSLQYKEMSRILDSIVELQATQTQLEALVQEKHYLHAVRILSAAEKIIHNHDLENVQALNSMREKLAKTKTFLKDTLTAELSNHLYLKNRSSFNRIGKDSPLITNLKVELAGSPTSDLLRFAKNTILSEEAHIDGSNVDFDSFNQMQVMLEGLFHLGTLAETMTFIRERISIEIYNLIDRVLIEVQGQYCKEETDANTDSGNPMPDHTIFQLFLVILYQRLQAIMEGHYFVIDCSHGLTNAAQERSSSQNGIIKVKLKGGSDEDVQSKSFDDGLYESESDNESQTKDPYSSIKIYTLREVAASIQNEVKGLLFDYLKSSDHLASATIPPVLAITEMLKENKKGLKRQMKQLYAIKISPDDYVKKMFKEACPAGTALTTPLTSDLPIPPSPSTISELFPLDSSSNDHMEPSEQGHRLLVPPHPSHILVSYKPTLDFMALLERKVNQRLKDFKMYLDDFVFNVYLPAIQEQVLVYYHASVNGIDAFQADIYPDALYPLIKSGLGIVLEINGICRIVKSMPAHSVELIKMIQSLLMKFYEKCWSRLRNVIVTEEIGLAETDSEEENVDEKGMNILSAVWAQHEDLIPLYLENNFISVDMNVRDGKMDVNENHQLTCKETAIQLQLKGERSIHRSELLMQPRKIQYLSNLAYGIEWVLDQIKYLRDSNGKHDSSSNFVASRAGAVMREFTYLSQDSVLDIKFDSDTTIELPTDTEELQDAFDTLENNFAKLHLQILYIIRNEVRCHTIYYLDLAIREGNYVGEEDNPEPDPYIGLLNTDLTEMEEIITNSISPRKARFIFDGITGLISTVLIHNIRQLRQLSLCGIERLFSNVVSLQQNLLSFSSIHETEREKDLDKCKKYLQLFKWNGPTILQFLSKNQGLFTYEEYKSVIELIYQDQSPLAIKIKNSARTDPAGTITPASQIAQDSDFVKEGKETLFLLKDYFISHRGGLESSQLDDNHLKRMICKKIEKMNDNNSQKKYHSSGSLSNTTPSTTTSASNPSIAGSSSQKLALFEKYFTQIMRNPMNLLSCPLNCCWFIYYVSLNNSPLFSTPSAPSLVSLFASSRHNSVEKLMDKKSHSTTTIPPSPTLTNDKMTRLASVFNSFYIPQYVINAGFTIVSETDLLRDLLFVFQGIDGAFIQFTPSQDPSKSKQQQLSDPHHGSFKLRNDVKIPKPTREMVQQLCLLGWLFRMIRSELEYRIKSSRENIGMDGLYGQALVACIENELVEYKRLVCVLEGQLDEHIQSKGTFVSQDLSLKRLFVWTRAPVFKLSVLLAILQLTRDKKGCQILSLVYSYATHGDSGLQEYTSQLLGEICLPFYSQLVEFLSKGSISDPFGEFFCSVNYEVQLNMSTPGNPHSNSSQGGTSNYWKSKITFHKELVPAFMGVECAKKCFQVGKSVEFLSSALNLPPPLSLDTIISPLSSLTRTHTFNEAAKHHQRAESLVSCMDVISSTVEKAHRCVSPFLVGCFMEKELVVDTFHVLCDFMLLGKGDFCLYLMEQLEDTLEKPAQTIYRHDLVGVLESAIRDCNSSYDSKLLSRLDVCLLESQSELSMVEKGWDVFTLDYRLSSSLDTVFSPSSMRIYQKVFSFLWRIKRIGYRLLKGYKTISQSHSSQLLLHKMIHFTSILTQHLFQTLATLEQEFEKALEKVEDLDQVVHLHVLFLRKVCDQVLFASHKSATVFQGILGVLESIGEMESLMRPNNPGSRLNRHNSFLSSRLEGHMDQVDVKELGVVFTGKVKEFLTVLGEAGYAEVVSKLDFNEEYELI